MKTLFPPKEGLNHDWQPGEVAIVSANRFPHVVILEPAKASGNYASVLCLSKEGAIQHWSPSSLLTIEGVIRCCNHMRDDWTGREYREAVELARTGMPFEVPENWEGDLIGRALELVAYEHASAVYAALDIVPF